ncbi:hypothetical protein [Mesorhizobium sp. NPDC059025]|uniref:hypothetical protein n=1 Tax=unclassified Mesorhizobium TaxID=325217 RepID=UPI003699C8D7
MSSDFSAYTTIDLLRLSYAGADQENDVSYKALWAVFARWREGIDLEPLIELLQSEKSGERARGVWFLDEADPPAELMADVVLNLAHDSMSSCRSGFLVYVTNSGLYGDAIADRLATCLLDLDLYVRARTIFWAIVASDEKFTHFSEAVLSGAGRKSGEFHNPENTAFWRASEQKRAVRGIEIARRLRAGEAVTSIRKTVPEEDSLVFDDLAFLDHAIKSALERRAAKAVQARKNPEDG